MSRVSDDELKTYKTQLMLVKNTKRKAPVALYKIYKTPLSPIQNTKKETSLLRV